MNATLTFPTRIQAERFAINWSRYSKKGHTIGAGLKDVKVDIYDLDDNCKEWVDNYVLNENQK